MTSLRFATPLLLASALLCGGCAEEESGPTFPEITPVLPDTSSTGVLRGVVRFEGLVPPVLELEPPDGACRMDGHRIIDERWMIKDGLIRDVVIEVSGGRGDWVFDWNRDEAVVDQVGCVFKPHVLAVRTYQPTRFKNSDSIIHNVNISGQPGFPFGISPSQGSRIRQFTAPANKLRVTCDLHSNMLMYVYVFDHPYFAVTGEDGRFEIQGLPPGDYEVTARHGVGGAQKAQVEIPAGGASEDLEFVYRR